MTSAQLGTLYAFVIILFVAMFAALSSMLDKPTSAEQYADKFCQQTYGPQVAAYWVADRMMCITQRGEILPTKRP